VAGKTINLVSLHTWPQQNHFNCKGAAPEVIKASAAKGEGDMYREQELRWICEHTILTDRNASENLWLMAGDFNAVSRADNWHLHRSEDDKAFLLNDYISSNTPYIDLIERWYPGEYQKSTFSGRRIDFIYMTESLFSRVTDARTIHDGFATASRDPRKLNNFCNPSDHYPIAVELEF
jgi:endonuclease/exonuclease/phosphatase family metal-dependent hydrolase